MIKWKHLAFGAGVLFGILLLVVGILEPLIIPFIFEGRIKERLPLKNNTEAYERFTRSKVPIHASIYLFNVTNVEQVQQGAKPKLQQVGPFSFTETRRKEVTAIKDNEQTLDYKLTRTWHFDEQNSTSLNSIITLPNVPVFAALYKVKEKSLEEETDISYNVITEAVSNESLYLTNTADAFLFKGMRMGFLDDLEAKGVLPDDAPPNNTFGFYYGKNNTWDKESDGIISLSTGVDGDFANIGKVTAWNGKKTMSFWKPVNSQCNTFKGTDGQFFHPSIKKDEKLDIFAPDLCRTLTIEYLKTVSIRSIELYRFGISPSFFKPADSLNETKCYCVKRGQDICKHGGVIDAAGCRKKPIVVSTPHFYNGDDALRDKFEGLEPSQADHDTYIDIEPMTGNVLRARRRLQVNLAMKSYDGVPMTSFLAKSSSLIHPILYIDQNAVIPDDLAQKLESKLTKKVRMARIFLYAALFTGPIILVAALIFICLDVRSTDKKGRAKKVAQDTGGDYQVVALKPVKEQN